MTTCTNIGICIAKAAIVLTLTMALIYLFEL
jgi:hypothetical protein